MFGLSAYAEVPFASLPGGNIYNASVSETGTGTDSVSALVSFASSISETGTGTDTV